MDPSMVTDPSRVTDLSVRADIGSRAHNRRVRHKAAAVGVSSTASSITRS